MGAESRATAAAPPLWWASRENVVRFLPSRTIVLLSAFFLLGSAVIVVAQEPGSPPARPAARPGNNVRPAIRWKQFSYTCENGQKLAVHLLNETAKVIFNDHIYLMRQVPAAEGARYSDGKAAWWSKGDGGFLQADSPDGDGEMIVKGCQLDEPADAVTGTVSYLARIAIPPEAILQVQLQDITQADAPAIVIAEEKSKFGKRQVPFLFELKFDPAKIDPQHIYSIRANIVVENQVRFTTDQVYRVLTGGNPRHVDVNLKPLAATLR